MGRSLLAFCLIGGSLICSGQTEKVQTGFLNNPEIKFAYNSSLIYPGLSAGVGFSIKEEEISNKKGKALLNPYTGSRLAAVNMNWYHHSGFHDNLYFALEWIIRKTRRSGYFSEFSAGPGYSRTFLDGTTYRFGEDGAINERNHFGYNYALITAGWGAGYSFRTHKGMPLKVFAKINIISMFPYNSTIYFRPVLELGIRFDRTLFSGVKNEKNEIRAFK